MSSVMSWALDMRCRYPTGSKPKLYPSVALRIVSLVCVSFGDVLHSAHAGVARAPGNLLRTFTATSPRSSLSRGFRASKGFDCPVGWPH